MTQKVKNVFWYQTELLQTLARCSYNIWRDQAVPHFKKKVYGIMIATSVHLFNDATCPTVESPFLLYILKCLPFFMKFWKLMCLESSQCLHFTPWNLSGLLDFVLLASCSNVWSDFCAQHCARVFLWIIFIGNKLFLFPGNEVICYGSTFCRDPR